MRPAYAYGLLGIGFIMLGAALVYGLRSPHISMEPTSAKPAFAVQSPVFENGAKIPSKYTCDGDRTLSPPLALSGIPVGTKALALVMDDPDVPKARKPDGVFDHWVVYDILPPSINEFSSEGGNLEIPEGFPIGSAGLNGAGEPGYTGPCPPPEYEPSEHRYFFKAFALSKAVHFDNPPTKQELLDAISKHIIAEAELMGRYKKNTP